MAKQTETELPFAILFIWIMYFKLITITVKFNIVHVIICQKLRMAHYMSKYLLGSHDHLLVQIYKCLLQNQNYDQHRHPDKFHDSNFVITFYSILLFTVPVSLPKDSVEDDVLLREQLPCSLLGEIFRSSTILSLSFIFSSSSSSITCWCFRTQRLTIKSFILLLFLLKNPT